MRRHFNCYIHDYDKYYPNLLYSKTSLDRIHSQISLAGKIIEKRDRN